MAYVAVSGGEEAIESSIQLLEYYRSNSQKDLELETIETKLSLLVDRVMSEAGLSYLGLGIQPPTPSFGKMLSEAQGEILQAGWYVLVPAAAITLLVMGFNLIGDALQEVTQHGR